MCWLCLGVVLRMKFVEADNEGYRILLKDVPVPHHENETFGIKSYNDTI